MIVSARSQKSNSLCAQNPESAFIHLDSGIQIWKPAAKLPRGSNESTPGRLSDKLIQDDNGQPLRMYGLRSRFGKAWPRAGVRFQFSDLRAEAATDTGDLAHSQALLGHTKREMTKHYVKRRIGERVKPLR